MVHISTTIVLGVPPSDVASMRRAIQVTLADSVGAEQRAARGYDLAVRRYDMDRFLNDIIAAMLPTGSLDV